MAKWRQLPYNSDDWQVEDDIAIKVEIEIGLSKCPQQTTRQKLKDFETTQSYAESKNCYRIISTHYTQYRNIRNGVI